MADRFQELSKVKQEDPPVIISVSGMDKVSTLSRRRKSGVDESLGGDDSNTNQNIYIYSLGLENRNGKRPRELVVTVKERI